MTGCSYPPTYDGIGVDEYMEWEIAIDNIFDTRFMCLRRKVKNAASVLRHSATPMTICLKFLVIKMNWLMML